MAGQTELATAALQELHRAQPNISLAWIASEMPIMQRNELEHYLDAFRRGGLRRSPARRLRIMPKPKCCERSSDLKRLSCNTSRYSRSIAIGCTQSRRSAIASS